IGRRASGEDSQRIKSGEHKDVHHDDSFKKAGVSKAHPEVTEQDGSKSWKVGEERQEDSGEQEEGRKDETTHDVEFASSQWPEPFDFVGSVCLEIEEIVHKINARGNKTKGQEGERALRKDPGIGDFVRHDDGHEDK